METESYEVVQAFLHDNVSHAAGARIELTPAQAAYPLAGGFVRPAGTTPAKPKPAGKGARS